jgi:hypothetical protein
VDLPDDLEKHLRLKTVEKGVPYPDQSKKQKELGWSKKVAHFTLIITPF